MVPSSTAIYSNYSYLGSLGNISVSCGLPSSICEVVTMLIAGSKFIFRCQIFSFEKAVMGNYLWFNAFMW